ncbi:aminotransferase class V-fold PLP-dependent enzyme [Alteromonas sp. ASW11-130]|uniref:aminotransferase class V-fold PLP-dependent enzyme n=1 Tax=Alteromonas sp. ASW11-130 TaxID=3015775 RepID=UPI002241A0B4|nr:aminotransferase class V-fold PLP-dependent enzyme [Alteromonas sp. ASW11-130]MCW8090850.1 aminotransferase class V-fold PLP-dependent enzyme [Alteromonas sp. ASW11-130]
MYQQFYQRFLKANQGKQHYSCHSHYFWPDVTRDAMLAYWDDSAKWVDDKWSHFFKDVVPCVQRHISHTLGTDYPEQIVFAPNTHEFVFRILSCLDLAATQTIVTTDSEFHSFNRQINRLDEMDNIEVVRVPTQPFATFNERFINAIQQCKPNLVFFSQVFFNSGYSVQNIDTIVEAVKDEDTLIVIDGYHAFMAQPVDISAIQQRVFYLAGGYKYAQSGEGVCFAHVPPNTTLRPVYTGWYAEFGALEKRKDSNVQYSDDGMRFGGATMDFSGLYRMRSVFELLLSEGISVGDIHAHVKSIQHAFLFALDKLNHHLVNRDALLVKSLKQSGHFLTFSMPDDDITARLAAFLKEHGVLTDYRGDRLRFGFALYHNADEIDLTCLSNFKEG